jgi:hypothetical protein
VELGVKFSSDRAGSITGLRFYKGTGNTGTHVGSLWSSTGTLLGQATFTNETASGWQQVSFSSPVTITANTTFVASYHAPGGQYAVDANYFALNGVDNAPLHAPSTGSSGGNGLYAYGFSSVFPSNTYNGSNYWVDVVFSASSSGTPTPTATSTSTSIPTVTSTSTPTPLPGTPTATPTPSGCPCTIWPSSATPGNASVNDDNAVELGVKFQADTNGYISGLRFYKGSGNNGTHIGNLWTSSGTLLATASFGGETASGWQQVTLASPVAITAGTTYVASYFAPVGHYAGDLSYFNASFDRPPLHALASGASGGNGVYAYSFSSTYPTNSYNASNYWVDVVFSSTAAATSTPTPTPTSTSTAVPGTPTFTPTPTVTPTATPTPIPGACPCTLWPSTAVPTNPSVAADLNSVEVGVKFRSDVNGHISGLRFYKAGGNSGAHIGSLWSSTGTLLAQATFAGETASGWQQVSFGTPIAITANTTYVASYHAPVGQYAADQSYFNTSTDRAPLHAPDSAGSGGNGVYVYGASTAFPSNTYMASNYWVDVILTTP